MSSSAQKKKQTKTTSNESPVRSTPSTSTTTARPSDEREDEAKARPVPVRWTLYYIPSTRVLVLRFFCEASWRCYHDPIMVLVPWSPTSRFASFIKAASYLFVPVGLVLRLTMSDIYYTEAKAARTRVEAADNLFEMMDDMNIAQGGLFTSAGYIDASDQVRVAALLGLQTTQYKRDLGVHVSKLKYVDRVDMWVASHVVTTPELQRSQKPQPTAMLLFERVTDKLRRRHRRTLIHWQLTKMEFVGTKTIDSGVACVGEPVPVVGVTRAELAECELSFTLTKNQRVLGKGSIALDDIPLGPAGSEGKGCEDEDNDEMETWRIRVGAGHVVHFRMLEPPEDRDDTS